MKRSQAVDSLDREGLDDLLRWRQAGVVSLRQLIELGASELQIARMLRRRDLSAIHPGVYVDHTGAPTREQQRFAATLLHAPAALSGRHALPNPPARGPIEVAVDARRTVRAVPGVSVRRMQGFAERVDAMALPARIRVEHALIDVLEGARDPMDVFTVAADVIQTRQTTAQRVLEVLAERQRVRARQVITAILTDLAEGRCSFLERSFVHDLQRPHGLPALRPQRPKNVHRRRTLQDMASEEFAMVVELDGMAFHNDATQRDLDGERDLVALGRGRRAHRATDDRPGPAPRLSDGWLSGGPLPATRLDGTAAVLPHVPRRSGADEPPLARGLRESGSRNLRPCPASAASRRWNGVPVVTGGTNLTATQVGRWGRPGERVAAVEWINDAIQHWLDNVNWVSFATIPIFTGVIGWLINWTGLIMLFSPVRFHGVKVPGMRELATVLPRKLQEIPGFMQGGLGWQGIVPARAAKMGSIAVDKAISKLGTPADFYQQLEPDKIAEHIVNVFRPEVPELVDEVMSQEHPRLWRDLPPTVKRQVYERVQSQLPSVVGRVTDEIGVHIDQLLDPKIMVIDHFQSNPSLVVRIFRDFGAKELKLMVAFGFIFGFLLGIPVAIIDSIFHSWWLLPIMGVVVGWMTNALGMWLIFEPPEPKKILGITWHGLFLRRQSEAAEVYAQIIADDVITLERIGDFLLDGPRGDRTRQMLATALQPAIDQAAGPARQALRVAMGANRFDNIRDSVAQQAVGRTLTPFKDKDFSAQQADKIRTLVATRTKELPPTDFVDMMRSAIKEDEWMLYAHGAIMGAAGGFLHIWVFEVLLA